MEKDDNYRYYLVMVLDLLKDEIGADECIRIYEDIIFDLDERILL